MNIKIKSIIIIIPVLIFGVLLFVTVRSINEKNRITDNISKLQDFSFETIENSIFDNLRMDKIRPKVFIHFNSECDACQNEALKISNNLESFKDYQILYISNETPNKLIKFAKNYHLYNIENIIFLHDSENTFPKWVNSSSVPYILAYDNMGNLRYKNKGMANISELIKSLENETE